ncbi:MAG TPA: 5-(carboxyamino)imidazole ribonucleotide synthase [Candidatus Limnocylindrales bacterium]|nr:5-(carboxyamino)imidazole ribonucleotide synthase [Candidatus Limnocylindrales bacterium]
MTSATRPILPYEQRPAATDEWDPSTVDVARRVGELIKEHRPGLVVDHIGSSAVPGLPGKNVVDLGIEVDQSDVPAVTELLVGLGFQRQSRPRAFPPTRPLLIGSIDHEGRRYRIHAHVHPRGHRVWGLEHARDLGFRDALRADDRLRAEYADRKRAILAGPVADSYRYSMAKTVWIRTTLERLGLADPPILPPATIGMLGGGQLGRMLGIAARQLGYRFAVLDPDPACPAAAVADRVVQGAYDDTEAALEMASAADVVTLELEHVSLDVIARLDHDWPVRPGEWALAMTQDRIEERRFLESEGAAVSPWREVHDDADLDRVAGELGLPIRVKAARGGYDGRSQVRIGPGEVFAGALQRIGAGPGRPAVAERELAFEAELSVICARGVDGRAITYPVARNRHDDGILVESVAPAPIPDAVAAEASELARRLAEGLDLVGTLTVELFLMPDGSLVVNELAPRVHNSGHWSIDGAATSQFEQHIRAICGLPLGSVELRAGGVATVNLLGTGPEREARAAGLDRALARPDVHVHLYDKRRVFERRKMGHVTALGATVDEALARARDAAKEIRWQT